MHERKRKTSRRGILRLQAVLAAFWCGFVFSLPARSFADDLDDVLDDLINYRSAKRSALQSEPELSADGKAELAAKSVPREKATSGKPVLSNQEKAAKTAKTTATKK